MEAAQLISSLVLSLRKKAGIKVRQPLSKIMIPVANQEAQQQIEKVANLITSEVNIKGIDFLTPDNNILVKKIKPNFKTLGPRYGKLMKQLSARFDAMTQDEIRQFEQNQGLQLNIDGNEVSLNLDDAIINTQDIPGWAVTSEGNYTVALDMTITDELYDEGLAREIVNRVQNMRKDSGMEVTDHIILTIEKNEKADKAVEKYKQYISSETLSEIELSDNMDSSITPEELNDDVKVRIAIRKA